MSAFAVPVEITFRAVASGNPATVETATPVTVSAAVVHIGLKGERGDPGPRGLTGDVNPLMNILAEQATTAASSASEAAETASDAATAASAAATAATDAQTAAESAVITTATTLIVTQTILANMIAAQ